MIKTLGVVLSSFGRTTETLALSAIKAFLRLIDAGVLGNVGLLEQSELYQDLSAIKDAQLRRIAADAEIADVEVLKQRAQARSKIAAAVRAENRIIAGKVLEPRSNVKTAIKRLIDAVEAINNKGGEVSLSRKELSNLLTEMAKPIGHSRVSKEKTSKRSKGS